MRRSRKSFVFGSVVWGLLLASPTICLATSGQQTAPDNTKNNQDTSALTADKAKNARSDTQMMAHIRRDVVQDKSLSTYGHNVKIICHSGKVTLRGPVHTDEEKKAIVAHATKYAGDENVTDEITVKSASK